MKRRDLLALVGGAAVTWPLVARAQAAVPVVGVLFGGSAAILKVGLRAFFAGLGELGFVDGHNIAIEIRTAEGGYERLPALASDLVGRKVNVIVSLASPASLAAKAATSEIPIVSRSPPTRLLSVWWRASIGRAAILRGQLSSASNSRGSS
jgi:putative ABC transport system substrate-binding protein